MEKQKACTDCGVALQKNEVALCLKMLGRTITMFYCISCLADMLDCVPDDLIAKIQEFKDQGCALFSSNVTFD